MRLLVLSLILLVGGFAWLLRSAYQQPALGEEISLSQVYALAKANGVSEARLLDQDSQVVGKRCKSPARSADPLPTDPAVVPGPPADPRGAPGLRAGCAGPQVAFHASYPRSDVATQQLIGVLSESGAGVRVDNQTAKEVTKLVATFVFPCSSWPICSL